MLLSLLACQNYINVKLTIYFLSLFDPVAEKVAHI